jgi:plasmid stabilization system protein ParE
MKLLDRMLNWFCARRRDDQTEIIKASIKRQNLSLAEMNRQGTEDADAITDYQRRVLDLTARRAAIYYRDDAPSHHGDPDARHGGHAPGGAA